MLPTEEKMTADAADAGGAYLASLAKGGKSNSMT
jgi:hypothetical protein